MRGGHQNDHDFDGMAETFTVSSRQEIANFANAAGKELSPVAMTTLVDLVSRRSLSAVLSAQKILWILSALLLYALLRSAEFSPPASPLAAGLLFFNFLSVLNSYSFSTTDTNIFYFLGALYSVVSSFRETSAKRLFWHLTATACSGILVALTGRLELAPVAASRFYRHADAALELRMDREDSGDCGGPPPRRCGILLAGFALSVALCVEVVRRGANTAGVSPSQWRANLIFQLGEANLSTVFQVSPESFVRAAVGLLLCALLIPVFLPRARCRAGWARASFLFAWIMYFSAIYTRMEQYPLYTMRHQLYFFLPFPILAALAFDRMLDLLPAAPFGKRARLAAVSIALFGYEAPRTCGASKRRRESRGRTTRNGTSFWRRGRRGRRVAGRSTRSSTRAKEYCPATFRRSGSRIFPNDGCSPGLSHAFIPSVQLPEGDGALPDWDRILGDSLEGGLLLAHRYYSNLRPGAPQLHNPVETLDPVQVRIGFYRLDPAFQAAMIRHRRTFPYQEVRELDSRIVQASESIDSGKGREGAEDIPRESRGASAFVGRRSGMAGTSPIAERARASHGRALPEARFLADRGVLKAELSGYRDAIADFQSAFGLRSEVSSPYW